MAKRTPIELWADIEDDVLRAEADRIEALTPDEVRRELEDAGFDLEKVQADAERIFERLRDGEEREGEGPHDAREGRGESPHGVREGDGDDPHGARNGDGDDPHGAKAEAVVEGREFSLLRDAARTAERVSRDASAREMRRSLWPRAAWLLAAALGCAVIAFIVWRAVAPVEEARKEPTTPETAAPDTAPPPPGPAPPPTPAPPPPSAPAVEHLPTARELRDQAVRACEDGRWDDCLRAFDRAREMDPKGDGDSVVQRWRRRMSAARDSLESKPAPTR